MLFPLRAMDYLQQQCNKFGYEAIKKLRGRD
jgi:hypothetical protein